VTLLKSINAPGKIVYMKSTTPIIIAGDSQLGSREDPIVLILDAPGSSELDFPGRDHRPQRRRNLAGDQLQPRRHQEDQSDLHHQCVDRAEQVGRAHRGEANSHDRTLTG
jgi:hypothetical protein